MIKVVDNYVHALEFNPNCCKTEKMCNKAVNTNPFTIRFVLDQNKTQEMSNKSVNPCFSVFHSVLGQYKAQKMCDRAVYENPYIPIYFPNRYKTQKYCDEDAGNCLAASKFIPDRFFTSKTLEKFHDALFANDDIPSFGEMDILCVNLDKTNLDDDNNLDEDDPDTIIHVRLLAWHNKFGKRKTLLKR